MVVIWVVIAH